jgi:hypothetical protein
VAAVGALLGLFLAFGSGTRHRQQPLVITPALQKTRTARPHALAAPAHLTTERRAAPTLSVSASRGNCWLLVRAGSASGPILYEATLAQGHSLTFTRHFLWVRLGAPANADVRVRGVLVPGLLTLAPTNLLVSPKGARPA